MVDQSSSDEEFKSNLNLPNLDNLRKHHKQSKSKPARIALATRKLHSKLVRFPDSYTPRDTIISNSSRNSLDLDLLDGDAAPGVELPKFEISNRKDVSESESDEEAPHVHNTAYPAYSDLSDDDYDTVEPFTAAMRKPSVSGSNREIDITDIRRLESRTSRLSSRASGERKPTFRDIIRRISLANQAFLSDPHEPSASDTFLGRVMSLGGGGLSGGGLAPGASRHSRERTIDEEEEVGGDIEMRRLDFDEMNDEAKKLISLHAPEILAEGLSHDLEPEPRKSAEQVPHLSEFRQDNDDGYIGLDDEDEVAPPHRVQPGVLLSLLKLYQSPEEAKLAASLSTGPTLFDDTNSSGELKFKRMSDKMHFKKDRSTELSFDLDTEKAGLPSFQNAKPKAPKKLKPNLGRKLKNHKRMQNEKLRITVHIADILQRQRFIMQMCKALMLFGAPTHRLEEYMVMTSRVLEIDGQFIYFPGCMIVAFGDAATRTSEVHLVRCVQGLNLSKLADTHAVYKGVIHDYMGVEEAATKLEELLRSPNQYNPWVCVLLYGLGLAAVTPFAFSGNWFDVPISFGIGLCVGYLQFFLLSISNLYSSVFEVTASIVVSFIARAIGSINNSNTFCFGAIAQGLLALILPGYIILCGSLELQSKNLVAGSVRMFYAVIYSLFLGFGITLGAALYGWVDSNATDKAVCDLNHPVDDKWRILLVPMFSICLGLINQARWRQIPVMVVISSIGYVGTYFAGKHFQDVTEFTAAIGAFIIGILGNMYSRIGKGMAVSAMLPGIFLQVPSGIASKSTLLSGIDSANKITGSENSSTSDSSTDVSSLSFGATMVEVSIGISVGLFAAALCVYPFGKRRTSLFTM